MVHSSFYFKNFPFSAMALCYQWRFGRYIFLVILICSLIFQNLTWRRSLTCIFVLKLGHSTEADASSGSPVKTLKRTFSFLQSTTRGEGESSVGPTIPFHQIISLVSMTSPRTFGPHRVYASPAFVEFDMSESGYGWVSILVGVGALY